MDKHWFEIGRLPWLGVFSLLLMSVPAIGADKSSDADAEAGTIGYVQDYLSDYRRVGSLVGSVFGGALTAHPLGPVLGSVFGFLIGKTTMNEDPSAVAPSSVARIDPRRAIVPSGGTGVAAVSFDQGGAVSFDASPSPVQPLPVANPLASPAAQPAQQTLGGGSPSGNTWGQSVAGTGDSVHGQNCQNCVVLGPESGAASGKTSPSPTFGLQSREQIASLCSGSSGHMADPRLRNVCFYFRGN